MAGIEAVPFGLLVLVVGALALGSAWAVVDVKLTVVAAAREAARSAAEADSLAGAEDAARRIARDVDADVTLSVDGGRFRRCARLEVRVVRRAPALSLPWIGGTGGVDVAATHSEVIDPFREGVADPAPVSC